MELKIIDEKENLLFKRKEIKMEITREVTPSHAEVEKIISEKFSAPFDLIKIKKISGKFGSKKFEINANIYSSKEEKENTEIKSKKENKQA